MKQTAVEWLVKELEQSILMTSSVETTIKKAKEMEKQQRIDAYDDGKEDVFDWLKKMDYDFLVEEINKTE